jgi:predicted transcriptional regulator
MVVVNSEVTVSEAIRLINKGLKILVVAENGKFIGFVSEKDLLSCLLWEYCMVIEPDPNFLNIGTL